MWSTTLKGIAGHKRRFLATCTAVFLGVAFLTATLVLGDSVKASFADMFTEANAGTAVVVRDATRIGDADMAQRGLVEPATVEAVRGVDGVAATAAVVEGTAQILDADGDPLGGQGPPTIGGSWIEEPALNPYQLAEGRAPELRPAGEPIEVVLDRQSAEDGGLALGSQTVVQTPEPTPVEVVGIATFGENDSMAGVTYTGMTATDATRLLAADRPGASEVRVAAAPGVGQDELAARVGAVLPDGDEAITGQALSDEQLQQIEDDFLGMMSTMLLVFAGIALLVAAFSIHNTFAIVAAQKAKESALLRAIGATRRQVLGSVLLESLAVGVLATIAGLAAGVGLGAGLLSLLGSSGIGLPAGTLAVGLASLVAGAVVGLGVTLVASLSPAISASRISPLAAMRSAAVETARISPVRLGIGGVAFAGGVALIATGTTGGGDLGRVGLGSLATIVGFLMVAPLLARGAARVIGLPGRWLRGVTGQLAQENAVRNPRRTASTATALVIGMGVVTLFTVFGASLKATVEDEVTASFGQTDLVVESTSFAGSGIAPGFTSEVASIDGVTDVAPLAFGDLRLDGQDETGTVTDPASLAAVSDLGVIAGDLATLEPDQVAVSELYAEERGWAEGTVVEAAFADGTTQPVTIGAVYEQALSIGSLVVPEALWTPHSVRQVGAQVVLVGLGAGADEAAVQQQLDDLAAGYGDPTVRTRAEYLDAVGAQVDQLLTVVYILLAVAVVIALLGIANTLSLSIHERTRELGVLRAVGQTRSQLRSSIRWESVVVSVFGTVAGLGLGVLVGWGLVWASSGELDLTSFSVPPGQLALVLVAGAIVGVLAAVRPARRAARLDVLTALAAD